MPVFSSVILLICRVVLAAIFAAAGIAKSRNFGSTRKMLSEFGVPETMLTLAGLLLIGAELSIAVLLLVQSTTRIAALLAVGLLSIFSLVITLVLRRDERPECNCFGQIAARPVGLWTLLRNLLFIALAIPVATIEPSAVTFGVLESLDNSSVISVALASLALSVSLGTCFLMFMVVRQQGRILNRLDDFIAVVAPSSDGQGALALSRGAAPDFEVRNAGGRTLTLADLRATRFPSFLIFVNAGCGPCNALLPEIAVWCAGYGDRINIVLIAELPARSQFEPQGLESRLFFQSGRDVSNSYKAHGTPAAVLISPKGLLEGDVALGADSIRALFNAALGFGAVPAGLGQARSYSQAQAAMHPAL